MPTLTVSLHPKSFCSDKNCVGLYDGHVAIAGHEIAHISHDKSLIQSPVFNFKIVRPIRPLTPRIYQDESIAMAYLDTVT